MHVITSPPSAAGMLPSQAAFASPQASPKNRRMDTQDLKSKLATALGSNGKRYWSALLAFMTAKIDRTEFEEEAMMCLKPQHVHLHNSLVLGLLYNASADVPGPSSRAGRGMPHDRDAHGQLIDIDGNVITRFADLDDDENNLQVLQPAKKRLRLLTAGLSRKERARIRNIPKQLSHARMTASGAAASSGWAGAGADMLEKKRKEEDKRRSADEKQRVKEAYSEVGAKDWKSAALQSQAHLASVHENLSMATQHEIARALAAPLCVESKQLPDLELMRDLMTLQSIETGLTQSAQPQAAAMLLAALQCHLQNVMASIITKIRANRQVGIRVTGIERTPGSLDELTLVTADQRHDEDQIMHEADESMDSTTEASQSHLTASDRHLRAAAMLHDTSSISSSNMSLGMLSAADSSMMSLASTAPTSLPPGSVASSENASNNGASGASSRAGRVKKSGEAEDDEMGDVSASSSDLAAMRGIVDGVSTSSSLRKRARPDDGPTTLELRHLSFLLDVAPHTVVESLGQGSQERLLAADWTRADEQAQREYESTAEGMIDRQARITATSRLCNVAPAALGVQQTPATVTRNRYIVDQLAPIRLFDRRTLAETQAASQSKSHQNGTRWTRSEHPQKGGLSLPSGDGEKRSGSVSVSARPSTADSQETKADARQGDADAGDVRACEDEIRVDLSAVIASRYGHTASSVQNVTPPTPTLAIPSNGTHGISPHNQHQHHHHRGGQDPHLYEVVDPVALLAGLVN